MYTREEPGGCRREKSLESLIFLIPTTFLSLDSVRHHQGLIKPKSPFGLS